VSLDGAGCGLTCRSGGVIMAGCVLPRPCVCGRWLPVWLPGISLAALMFSDAHGPRPIPAHKPSQRQLGLGQKQIAAAMGVSVARVSQIEHGEVTSFEVIARYVEALGARLDLVADFGDRTIRLPVSDTPTVA
jgi:Helix-turn-helix domain